MAEFKQFMVAYRKKIAQREEKALAAIANWEAERLLLLEKRRADTAVAVSQLTAATEAAQSILKREGLPFLISTKTVADHLTGASNAATTAVNSRVALNGPIVFEKVPEEVETQPNPYGYHPHYHHQQSLPSKFGRIVVRPTDNAALAVFNKEHYFRYMRSQGSEVNEAAYGDARYGYSYSHQNIPDRHQTLQQALNMQYGTGSLMQGSA